MKVKMLKTAQYSHDGKKLIKRLEGAVCESLDNKKPIEDGKIHQGVIDQWLKQDVCREIKSRAKK
jgi:hypothetical protein